jgi:hypothetical protein
VTRSATNKAPTLPHIPADASAVSLRASPRTSRTLCRASTRFARAARRNWNPAVPIAADRSMPRIGLLIRRLGARLFGRRG